tara:strand:- start:202 stop:504 length:303 start_codon:yes stop_codon:yes gene_type:complete
MDWLSELFIVQDIWDVLAWLFGTTIGFPLMGMIVISLHAGIGDIFTKIINLIHKRLNKDATDIKLITMATKSNEIPFRTLFVGSYIIGIITSFIIVYSNS